MKLFCNHKWRFVVRTEKPGYYNNYWAGTYTRYSITIALLACDKCGKTKKVKMK